MAALTGIASITLGNQNSGNPPTYGSDEGIRQMDVFDKSDEINFILKFGDNASTYPSGGIPLALPSVAALTVPGTSVTISAAIAAAKTFGLQKEITDILLTDASNGDGYIYKIDKANLKIRIYQVPASSGLSVAAPLLEVTTSFVPASNVTLVGLAKGR